MMNILLLIYRIFLAVFIGIFLSILLRQDIKQKVKNRYQKSKNKNWEKISQNEEKRLAYEAMNEKLLAMGIKFRMGNQFSPFDYTVLRLGVGLLGGLFLSIVHPLLFFAGFGAGMVLIPLYFKQEDKNDNEEMLPDMERINSVVALQVKNGVFISKVMYECYRTTENLRLKQALLELSIDIENFASLPQAAQLFRKKFQNQYIDSFSKVLEQVQYTGQSAAFFEDIKNSIVGINEAITIKEEHRAEQVSEVFQILLFLAPLIIVFFILSGMLTSMGGLW